ncbi:MAG: hypothetical protein ACJASV_003236, partial [Pseudorhodobacter sp.]
MPQLEQSPGNCALEKALIVINPNSAQSVTDGIDAAMTP